MHMGPGQSAHRSKPSAPFFDLPGTSSRLYAEREVEAKMEGSDGMVDSMVYRAHRIITHGSSGGQRAGEQ
jgi:hypothetical protein